MTGDPKRWVDDPSVPPELREDLRRSAGCVPSTFAAGAGLERLRAALGDGTAGSAGLTGPGTAPTGGAAMTGGAAPFAAAGLGSTLSTGWLLGVAGAMTVAAGALWWSAAPGAKEAAPLRSPETLPSTDEARQHSSMGPSPAAASPLPGDPAPRAAAPSGEEAEDEGRSRKSAGPAGRHDGAEPQRSAPQQRLRQEVDRLARARALLTRRPAEALALVERDRVELASGVFAEEREAIAVLALHRMQRTDEAVRRARVFLLENPGSPFAERIEAVVAENVGEP